MSGACSELTHALCSVSVCLPAETMQAMQVILQLLLDALLLYLERVYTCFCFKYFSSVVSEQMDLQTSNLYSVRQMIQ